MTIDDHKLCEWPYPILPSGWVGYDDSKDYCGPENEWYSKHLSRYILGVDCNKCYWAHDNRYSFGKTEDDRKFADVRMRQDQRIAICRAYKWWSPFRYIALGIALRRYHAVRWFGKKAFNS